jgi:hypothetical protein
MSASFGAAAESRFGTITGWKKQSSSENTVVNRANAFDGIGNESQSELYDGRVEVTEEWKSDLTTTAPTIPASIGAVTNDYVLTGITVSTVNNDFATMTLTGHKHEEGSDGTLKSVSHGITMSRGFGTSAFGSTGGESIDSSSATIELDHAEVADAGGNTARGENHNPRVSITVTVLGTGVTAPSTYDTISVSADSTNTDFIRTTGEFYKPLQFT